MPRPRRILATLVRYNRFLGRGERLVFPSWVEAFLPWVVFLVLVVYIGASAYSVHKAESFDWPQLAPFIALVVLGLAFGIWFIVTFTGDATNRAEEQDRRRRQSFRFSYVFTLSTIVVMIVPVTNPWQPDVVGPISLIRGCVDARSDPGIPASIRCGADDLAMRFDGTTGNATTVAPADQSNNAGASPGGLGSKQGPSIGATGASSSTATPGSTPAPASLPLPKGTKSGVKKAKPHSTGQSKTSPPGSAAVEASAGSTASAPDAASTSNGKPPTDTDTAVSAQGASNTFERRFGRHGGFVYEPSYPWLIVIGGTYGTAGVFDRQSSRTDGNDAGPSSAGDAKGGSSAGAASSGSTVTGQAAPSGSSEVNGQSGSSGASVKGGAGETKNLSKVDPPDEQTLTSLGRKQHQVIEGGFVLPYYIVLLAFLGAAIALTRRIPELQKRSEAGYEEGTSDQPRLDFKTVREAVVFQIMQLVTAPFIAMVAFYAIAPASAGSGIAVGFISGFSSELVLLQIRGMVEGLFPKSVAQTAKSSASTGDVVGRVTFYDVRTAGQAAVQKPAVNVTVRISGDTNSNAKDYTDTTDSNGDFAIARVLAGSRVISATDGVDSKGQPLSAKRLIVVAPGAEIEQNLIVTPPAGESGGTTTPPPKKFNPPQSLQAQDASTDGGQPS